MWVISAHFIHLLYLPSLSIHLWITTYRYILDSYSPSWHLEVLILLTTSEIIKDTPEKKYTFCFYFF